MISIDGSEGEGGGQILRSSLALSIATGEPFELTRIRAGRKKPGLLRQHLVAVEAAARIGGARVEGAELRSSSLRFEPGEICAGVHAFEIGSAGSACLVVQAVLPALLVERTAGEAGPIEIRVGGGTHNPWAPPFPFLERVFLPLLARMGARVEAELVRPGFFPAGGGEVRVQVEPVERLESFELLARGEERGRLATAILSRIPSHVADRELGVVSKRLGWRRDETAVDVVRDSPGPGNALTLEVEFEQVTELVTAFGSKGVRAETVADHAVRELRAYLKSDAPVGPHLADQLLLPMALGGGGRFRTTGITGHFSTNVETIRRFLDVAIEVEVDASGTARVEVAGRG